MGRKGLVLLLLMCVLFTQGATAENPWDGEESFDPTYGGLCAVKDGVLTLDEGIVTLGTYYGEPSGEWDYVKDEETEALFEGNPGRDIRYDLSYYAAFSRVEWPESLRQLGSEAFFGNSFEELTLPARLERIHDSAFYYCRFDVLRIECALPWEEIRLGLCDCMVSAYAVPEEHPLYTVRDGVLYSKDGKTLLAYPNARTDAHFDVPAGVERIGRSAFNNEYLKTLSLPAGLKALEDYALAGCTRLQTAALPLTVTELGENAFYLCVSLEWVSLPEGMTAHMTGSGDWAVYYQDNGLYRGDNGDTAGTAPEEDGSEGTGYVSVRCAAILSGNGEGVPLYREAAGNQVKTVLPDGSLVYASYGSGNRVMILPLDGRPYEYERSLGYADAAVLHPLVDETLFRYDSVLPAGTAEDGKNDPEWEYFQLAGPYVIYDGVEGLWPISEAELFRTADGPEGEYGIVRSADPLTTVPLLDAPEGAAVEQLYAGIQLRVLEQKDGWCKVSTGFEEGWLKTGQFKPVAKAGKGTEK